MAYAQNPGKKPSPKTGAGVPSGLLQKDERTGESDPDLARHQANHPNSTVTVNKSGKKYNPYNKQSKPRGYTVTDKSGHSFSIKSGGKVKDDTMTLKDAINKTLKDERDND